MSLRNPPRRCRIAGPGVLMLAMASTVSAAAQTPDATAPPRRFFRSFSQDDGLPSGVIFTLSQDPDGFLWIGTASGLARYGGRDFVSVRPDLFGGGVEVVATSISGDVAVLERGRRELWLGRDRAFQRVVAAGDPLRTISWTAFDTGDTLWVIHRDGALMRRSPRGDWLPPRDTMLAQLRLYRVVRQPDGTLLLVTREAGGSALWRWRDGRSPVRLAGPVPGLITTATGNAGGPTWFASNQGGVARLYHLDGGRLEERYRGVHRPMSVAVRGDVVYYSDPTGLLIVDDDGTFAAATNPTVTSGGPLLVDREGSLWLGTAAGLLQFPEPATTTWGTEHGLIGSHAEYIAATAHGIWISSWQGLGLLEWTGSRWRARDVQARSAAWAATRLCVAGSGDLWLWTQASGAAPPAVATLSGEGVNRLAVARRHVDCSTAPDGTVFIIADTVVHRSRPGGRIERLAGLPAHMDGHAARIAGGRHDDVHVADDFFACDATIRELRSNGEEAWRCSPLPGIGELRALHTVDGPGAAAELWLASFTSGILRRTSGEWRPVAALQLMPQRASNGLAPSPRGGIWAFGFGFVVRLAPVDGEWRIVEELGGWHGIDGDVRGLTETDDGSVWLASWHGVTRVPASARSSPPMAPHTRLAALRVDGLTLTTPDAALPADHRAVEIEFATGALRDPHRVRYRTRIGGVAWTVSPDPVFRVARLPAGRHVIEAAASLDGNTWGEPYRLELDVASAWYARGWVLALVVIAATSLALLAHRVRTTYLVGLERQRTRIAMDLHDELGAGLGSLGILGGVVAEGSAPAPALRQVGETIARTAGELGEALHDIVHSLRTGEARLEHLAQQLCSRGRSLFAGDHVRFTTDISVSGNGGISPVASRHAYRIAVEALHNAARHAGAENVELGMHADATHGRVHLWIHDDGRGIDPDTLSEPGGMGLHAMQRRAEALGGRIEIASAPGMGTRIAVHFASGASRLCDDENHHG